MFVRRCAWHRQYHGRVKYLGVASWRGWGLTFSDGMCSDCAGRARAEWRLPSSAPKLVAVAPMRRSLRPDFALAGAVVVLAVTVALGLIVGPAARSVSQPPSPATSVANLEPDKSTVGEAAGTRTATAPPPPSEQAARPGSPSRPAVVDDSSPAAGVPSRVAAAPVDRVRPITRPVRIARAAVKRPVLASYEPVPVAMPVEVVSVSEPAVIEVAPAPAPMPVGMPAEISALARIEVQAP